MTDSTAQLQHSVFTDVARHGRRRIAGWAMVVTASALFWTGVVLGVIAIVRALG